MVFIGVLGLSTMIVFANLKKITMILLMRQTCTVWILCLFHGTTLTAFIEYWNNHSLSTANNLTPNQMFIRGCIQQIMTPVLPHTSSDATGGGTGRLLSNSSHVSVPHTSFVPCPLLYGDITSRIDPLGSSSELGCDLYKRLLSIVGHHLQVGCNTCRM